jgi:PAP2 superfamily
MNVNVKPDSALRIRRRPVLFALAGALGAVALPSLGSAQPLGASGAVDPVVDWNRNLLAIVRTPGAQPATVHPTRSFAMLHAAIYDAVNAIDRTHQPYALDLRGISRQASQSAAAASAAHGVLVALYPAFQATLDAELQTSLAPIPTGPHRTQGIAVGQTAADAILALRDDDGSNAPLIPFVPGSRPGDYQLTPPNFPTPVFTHWPNVTPFALPHASQFRPGPPPALTSAKYTADFNEVKSLGFINSTTRTDDQTEIGRFWGGMIWDYWNEIAQTTVLAHDLTLAQAARLFALLNLTLADTVIAFYDAKYTYRFWRPVTAIRAADTDGNPQTTADPTWLPLPTTTAADPSYPGAHAVVSAGAARALDAFFGTSAFSLVVASEVQPGVTRSFATFDAAAAEATLSRTFAGQHFRFDLTAGRELGRAVAEFVVDHLLTERR